MPLHLSASLTQPHTHSLRGQLRGRIWSAWADHFTFAENNTKSPLCVCVCHIIPQRHLSGVSGQQMKHVIDLQCEVWPRCSCSLIDNGSVLMHFLRGPSSIPLYLRLYEIQMKFIYTPKGHNEIRGDQLKAGSKCY